MTWQPCAACRTVIEAEGAGTCPACGAPCSATPDPKPVPAPDLERRAAIDVRIVPFVLIGIGAAVVLGALIGPTPGVFILGSGALLLGIGAAIYSFSKAGKSHPTYMAAMMIVLLLVVALVVGLVLLISIACAISPGPVVW